MIEVLLNTARTLTIARRIEAKLDQLLAARDREEIHVTQEFSDLQQEVHQTRGLMESATTLIQGLAERFNAAAEDPAAVRALADELRTAAGPLATAIAANPLPTPANTGTGTTGSDTSSGTSAGGTAPAPGVDSATAQAEAQAPADTTGGGTPQ